MRLLLAVLGLTLCQLSLAERSVYLPGYTEAVVGNGLDLTTRELHTHSRCLKEPLTLDPFGAGAAELFFTKDMSLSQTLDSFHGWGKAEVDFLIAGGEGSVDYLTTQRSERRTIDYWIAYQYDGASFIATDAQVRDEIVQNPINHHFDCGDGFISGFQKGARLFAKISVILSSEEKLSELKAKFKAFFLGVEVFSATLYEYLEDIDTSAVVQMSVSYSGFDKAKFKIQTDSIEDMRHCNLQNYQTCITKFETMIQVIRGEDFSDIMNESTLEPITFYYTPYNETNLEELIQDRPLVQDPNSPARLLLYPYEDIRSKINMLEAQYYNTQPDQEEENREYHSKMDILNDQLTILTTAIDTCRLATAISNCRAAVDAAFLALN